MNDYSTKYLRELTPFFKERPRVRRVHKIALDIIRAFWEVTVEHLLEGDRILLPNDMQMYIGEVDDSVAKQLKLGNHHANLHTDGKAYGIKVIGDRKIHPEYRFGLRRDNAKELSRRLKNGQEYYK